MKFKINSVNRIETTKNNKFSWQKIFFYSLLTLGFFINNANAENSPNQNITNFEYIKNTENDGYQIKEIDADKFHIKNTSMMENIKKSTVFIVVANQDWVSLLIGSGSILKNHLSNGEKTILTVLHVGGTQQVNKNKIHMMIFSWEGKLLGVAKTMTKKTPKETYLVDSDQPTLLEFDTHYPINHRLLNKIEGLTIANRVPVGMLFGKINSGVGVSPGSSGGPWFNREGELIGVIDDIQNVVVYGKDTFNYNASPVDETIKKAFSHSLLISANHNILNSFYRNGNNNNPVGSIVVPRKDTAMIQGLGAPNLLKELEETALSGKRSHYITVGNMIYEKSFGLGYPIGFPMTYSANMVLTMEKSFINSVTANDRKEETKLLQKDRDFLIPKGIKSNFSIEKISEKYKEMNKKRNLNEPK